MAVSISFDGNCQNTDCVKENVKTRLLEAAAEGSWEECASLLDQGASINSADELGWTALMHAARNGHSQLVTSLMSLGADMCLANKHGVTAFTLAVMRCKDSLLCRLYDCLSPDELRQAESNNALQVACIRGLYEPVRWLLTHTSAQVNCVSPVTGTTPLLLAVIGHHYKLVELLLQFGSDFVATTALGQDVFELAAISGDVRLQEVLHHNTTPASPLFVDFNKTTTLEFETIDSKYTTNHIYLDLNGDIVLKNSPNRPVFKTCDDDCDFDSRDDSGVRSMLSPSLRSVFQFSPKQGERSLSQSLDNSRLHIGYSLNGLLSPRPDRIHNTPKSPRKSPKRGKKRKFQVHAGCSSWLKRFSKRRTKSVDDYSDLEDSSGSLNFNGLKQNGIDLTQLLLGMGLDDFFPVFKEQELDMWTFLTLTKEDIEAMGIHEPTSQELILNSIKLFRKTQL